MTVTTTTTTTTTTNASALAVRDSLQLLLREDPSLQLLLNEECSIQDFASTMTTTTGSGGDLDAKLALVESLAVKVSRTSPEAISQQFLTTDMKKFQTQGQYLLSSSRSVVATATRVETALSQQSNRLATAVTKLKHAIALQSAVKQLLKLHFESQKEFDLDDRRDLLKAAASVATMRQVMQSLREDQVKIEAKWKALLQERTAAIRQAVEAPTALLTTVLHVYHEWNELPQAVWNRVDQALLHQNNSNSSNNSTIAQGLDQMQFLQRILESQKSSRNSGSYYLDEVWHAIPNIYQPVAQYRSVVVCLWYRYCCQQRDNNWNNNGYAMVRSHTRDMLMQRSSSSSGANANGANGALLLLNGGARSSGILGGLQDDDDDDKDDDNCTTWTTTTSSSSTIAVGSHQNHLSYHDVQKSIYWKIFLNIGLERLEHDFLKSVQKRLIAPVHLMFPVLVLDESAAVGLPSKYDLQRFDEAIRNEIKLGIDDPSMIPIVAESIVLAVAEFSQRAAGNLVHGNYLAGHDFSMTTALQQDRKIVAILYALHTYLSKAPKTVFGSHTSAATAADCTVALRPALATIDATIHSEVIRPVVQQVQQQLHTVLARPYGPEFVQTHVATALERVTESVFKKFPPAYSSSMANEIAEHTVLTFVTTVSLIRPMSENLRLQITQDLADLELAVQQLVASSSSSGNTTTTEAWIHSKGYAELRAVRQMLYWTGLEQSSAKTAPEIAKSILREVWLSDVRPSTIFHYLFSFAPSALSAPYHVANISASAYVEQIVTNEETTWIMVCCDRYGQRGAVAASSDGDPRVAQIVLTLGQELLRRRGRNE